MISSMTGFGSSAIDGPNLSISVEAKTVNHRYLDVHVRLPVEFQSLESVVRKVVSSRLRRGRVDLFIKVDRARSGVRVDADPDLISAYVDLCQDLQSRFPISGELTVEAVSKLPGAIQIMSSELSADEEEALVRSVEAATREAVNQVCEMRVREGKALVVDLKVRLESIRQNLGTIRQCATVLLEHYRELLVSRVNELAPKLTVDSNRIEVEALMHAEKSNIAEEITRLESHLDQFSAILGKDAEAGKRMDFLLQEMNREVSTILSKTSGLNQVGSSIGESGIDIKVEIDKLREQVQNIE